MIDAPTDPHGGFMRLPLAVQWLLLVAGSAALAAFLGHLGVPASLLLGPLVAGIVMGVSGTAVRVPRPAYFAGQTVIGCMVANVITASIILTFLADWPLFLVVVFAIIGASGCLGWVMSRLPQLPGSTAIWGSSPGAASAMMLMAEAFGADAQLVAFMQYLRVVFVALAASLMARVFISGPMAAAPAIDWFPPIDPIAFGETLALAAIGGFVGVRLRLPAGAVLVPMVAGIVLNIAGIITIQLPEWLLALSYAMIGWNIGLGFTRRIVLHAAQALPQIVLSILALIAFCAGLAALLVVLLGVDPVTAYLATSPGGMDSVAIIAATTNVDLPFVMALQTVRFLLVLVVGPPLARFVARRIGGEAPRAP